MHPPTLCTLLLTAVLWPSPGSELVDEVSLQSPSLPALKIIHSKCLNLAQHRTLHRVSGPYVLGPRTTIFQLLQISLPLSLGFFHFKNEGGASLVAQW